MSLSNIKYRFITSICPQFMNSWKKCLEKTIESNFENKTNLCVRKMINHLLSTPYISIITYVCTWKITQWSIRLAWSLWHSPRLTFIEFPAYFPYLSHIRELGFSRIPTIRLLYNLIRRYFCAWHIFFFFFLIAITESAVGTLIRLGYNREEIGFIVLGAMNFFSPPFVFLTLHCASPRFSCLF